MDTDKKKLFAQYLPQFVNEVNPRQLLPYLPCLSMFNKEEIDTKQTTESRSYAVQRLHENLIRKRDGWQELLNALRHPEVNQGHLADLLDPPEHDKKQSVEDNISVKTKQRTVTRISVMNHRTHKDECDPNTLVKNLNANVRQILKRLDIDGLQKWDNLAGHLGFTLEECNMMKASKGESETLTVVDEWCKREDATLGKLVDILQKMERLDIIKDLERLTGYSIPVEDHTLEGDNNDCDLNGTSGLNSLLLPQAHAGSSAFEKQDSRVNLVRQESKQPGPYLLVSGNLPTTTTSTDITCNFKIGQQEIESGTGQQEIDREINQSEITRQSMSSLHYPSASNVQNLHSFCGNAFNPNVRDFKLPRHEDFDLGHNGLSSEFNSIEKKAGKFLPAMKCNSGDWVGRKGNTQSSVNNPSTSTAMAMTSQPPTSSISTSASERFGFINGRNVGQNQVESLSDDKSFEINPEDLPSFSSDIGETRLMQNLKSFNLEDTFETTVSEEPKERQSVLSDSKKTNSSDSDDQKTFEENMFYSLNERGVTTSNIISPLSMSSRPLQLRSTDLVNMENVASTNIRVPVLQRRCQSFSDETASRNLNIWAQLAAVGGVAVIASLVMYKSMK